MTAIMPGHPAARVRGRYDPVQVFELIPQLHLHFEPELAELDRLLDDELLVQVKARPVLLGCLARTPTSRLLRDPGDGGAQLVDPTGIGPCVKFNRRAEPKTGKNRLHLDMGVEDMGATSERLEARGDRVLARFPDHLVLADPEGNGFCIRRGPGPSEIFRTSRVRLKILQRRGRGRWLRRRVSPQWV